MNKELIIKKVYRSKIFVPFSSAIEKGLRWLEESVEDIAPMLPQADLELLESFLESFL